MRAKKPRRCASLSVIMLFRLVYRISSSAYRQPLNEQERGYIGLYSSI